MVPSWLQHKAEAGSRKQPAISAPLEETMRLGAAEIGNHGLPADRARFRFDQRPCRGRQIDIDARAETDEAEAIAGADRIPLRDEAHDAPRDKAGDLHHPDPPDQGIDDKTVAFIVFAGFVKIGIDEEPRPVNNLADAAGERRAVHMAIEHRHENRDAQHGLRTEAELRRRRKGADRSHRAIRGSNNEIVPKRGYTRRIAKEISAPKRQDEPDPAER